MAKKTEVRPATGHINPFGLRMQPGLRERLEASATEAGRSLNAEIVARLEASFPDVEQALLDVRISELAALTAEIDNQADVVAKLAADPAAQGSDQLVDAKTRMRRLHQQISFLEFQIRTIEDIRIGKGEPPMAATAEIMDFPKSSKRKGK